MSGPDPKRALPVLSIVEEDAEMLEGPDAPRVVLITGASGTIGRKLRAAWAGTYEIFALDLNAGDDEEVIEADLAEWDDDWVALLDEVDAVVHLAANPSPEADWPDLVGPNLDGLNHLFLAAANAGVERLVFASSNHAMGGYRGMEGPIGTELAPRPDGPYGATKLVGERLGAALGRVAGLSCVALRIGWVQDGPNRAETLEAGWWREMWLSDPDLIALFTRAIEAELEPGEFVVVNGMSANAGTRWSAGSGGERIGWRANDEAPAT